MIQWRGRFQLTLIATVFLACTGTHSTAQQSNPQRPVVRIGSKKFTEGVILGEVARHLVESTGAEVILRPQMVTNVLWNSLLEGEIDLYPEYTGTLMQEVLASENLQTVDQLNTYLEEQGLRMSQPLGFDNSYALGMKRSEYRERGANDPIACVTDLDDPALGCGSATCHRSAFPV